jgi:hypothetical protein
MPSRSADLARRRVSVLLRHPVDTRENPRVRAQALAGVSLVVVGTLSACSHGTQPSASAKPVVAPAIATTVPRGPIRDCATSAVGALGDLHVNRAGPIGFVDQWARAQLPIRRRGSRIRPTKILVVVDPGRTVTVTVPASEAGLLRLFYRQPSPSSPDGFYELSSGDRTMTFKGCAPAVHSTVNTTPTQFPGYFLVKQAGCYGVDVTEPGSTSTLHAHLSLGRPC